VARSPEELYELFLALASPRLAAARRALELHDETERARELEASLVPLAVDAALLGAEGMSALAHALATSRPATAAALGEALDALEHATTELGRSDASGARADESALLERARTLAATEGHEPGASAPLERARTLAATEGHGSGAPAPARVTPSAEPVLGQADVWKPDIGEDMVAAFLDECTERLDGLSERLIALEQRGGDPSLVAEVFRDLHTLKGSSAFAGLSSMNRVAHLAEDLIGELREGKRACDRALIDVLLETLDTLRIIVSGARAGQPIQLDLGPLLERLRNPNAVRASPREAIGAAVPGAPPEAAAVQATLRIDFSKVDLLLNLVGEAVSARGRLLSSVDTQAGLLRELGQVRTKLGARSGRAEHARPSPGPGALWLADLQRIERVLREAQDEVTGGLSALTLAVGQLRDQVMKLRMVPIARLFTKYQRTIRELTQKLGKEVLVELGGTETELDKVLVERLEDPLLHLVRNAVDHGIEPPDEREARGKPRAGKLSMRALQRGGQILVTISDDGRGMDPVKLRQKAVERGLWTSAEATTKSDAEAFELVFQAGFSTARTVSEVSGRGVGMDVVKNAIQKLKGGIAIDSHPGRGTVIELRLPLTLAITQVLVARVAEELVAIPLDAVVSAQERPEAFETVAGGPCLRVADRLIPVVELGQVLGLGQAIPILDPSHASVVLVLVGNEELGLLVDQVLGRHEVVIKSLGPMLAGTACAAGATLVGDRVLLVVDLAQVAERSRGPVPERPPLPRRPTTHLRARILVAEDSEVVRETLRRELTEAGFEVRAAANGLEALELVRREAFDLVSTDVVMPGLDGLGLARALRQDPRTREVPIVMMTSKDDRIDALRGLDAGADAYLTKPSDMRELIRTVEELLARAPPRVPFGTT
jgi:two-component system chemotaxis sensor kinase CheA